MVLGGPFSFKKRRERAKEVLEVRRAEEEADFRAKLKRESMARQALREEREKVAVERARARARQPSAFSQIVSQIGKANAPPKKKFVTVPMKRKKKKKRRAVKRVMVQERERPMDLFGGGGFI